MIESNIGYDDDDIRLDRWIKRHRPDIPHALLQRLLRTGKVRLDGRKAEASTRIRAGQTLTLPAVEAAAFVTPRPVLRDEDARRIREWVIYEDQHVIALNKPAGIAVQGGSKVRESIDGMLDALAKGGQRPKLVHRLDRDTSGVLLLARSAKAATELTRAFASREAQKTYWALVVGVPRLNEGTVDLALAKTTHGKSSFEKMSGDEDGKRAVTDYRVIEKLGTRMSWLELFPRTGRTHQLRAHMLAIRHPILGDGKYGGADAFLQGESEIPAKLHLHARRIEVEAFGQSLDITAPLTGYMKQTFENLGLVEK